MAALLAILAVGAVALAARGGAQPPVAAAPAPSPPAAAEHSTASTTAPPAPPVPARAATPAAAASAPADPAPVPAAERAKPSEPAAAPTEPSSEEPLEGGNPLPVDSPLDLPPVLQLGVPADATAPAGPLAARVLRSPRLGLGPGARRSVRTGRASAASLRLLLELGRAASPLIVLRARGGTVRVQATSLAATRKLVGLVASGHPDVALRLRPVPRDYADEAQSLADARTSEVGAKAAAIALSQVGVPYSWGGGTARGPSTGTCAGYHGSIRPCPATRTVGFDCSGLTLFAYAQVGVALDHYAAFQYLVGRRIASTGLLAGDLVFFNPKADGPGHVGMYVGNGRFVHAPRTGDVVRVSELSAYAGRYMGAVRPY